jgi:hypothetical protein
MNTKTQKLLPKMMPGTVHAQFVKCGKQNCKCSRGELHGAYFYHFVRVGGRLRKRYLKADQVEQTQIACSNRQREEKERIESSRRFWEEFRELRQELRELRSFYK